MSVNIFHLLKKLSLWHFIWVSVALSEIFTSIMSFVLTGKVTREFLITGAVVPVFVATFVIALVREMRKDDHQIQIFSSVLEKSPAMVVVADNQEHIKYANRSFIETYGYTRQDILSMNLTSLCQGSIGSGQYRQIMETIDSGGTWDDEILCKDKDGGDIWERIHMTALRDNRGSVTDYVLILEDITGLKMEEKKLRYSQHMLRLVMDTIPVRVFWKDLDLKYMGCNSLFSKDAGIETPDTIIGKSDFDMPWTNEADSYRADDRRVMDSGRAKLGFEEKQTTPEGKILWLKTSKVPLRDNYGNLIGVMGTYEDITREKLMEEDLRIKESAIDSSISGIIISSLQGVVTYANRSFVEMWGYADVRDVLEMKIYEFTRDEAEAAKIKDKVISNGQWSGDLAARRKDGAIFDVHLSASLVLDGNGDPLCLMYSFVDISEKKNLETKLTKLSVTDELTGLLNRRGFNMFSEKHLAVSQREDKDIYMLFADLDGLKGINDSYGHAAGDLAITLVADAIKSTFRESDIVGRVGGDEFSVLMASADDSEDELVTIERLNSAIDRINSLHRLEFQLSISVGVSKAPARAISSLEKLMSIADSRMYKEKLSKRKGQDGNEGS